MTAVWERVQPFVALVLIHMDARVNERMWSKVRVCNQLTCEPVIKQIQYCLHCSLLVMGSVQPSRRWPSTIVWIVQPFGQSVIRHANASNSIMHKANLAGQDGGLQLPRIWLVA